MNYVVLTILVMLNLRLQNRFLKITKQKISWDDYVLQFNKVMELRKIDEYIKSKYENYTFDNICLLCSEENMLIVIGL